MPVLSTVSDIRNCTSRWRHPGHTTWRFGEDFVTRTVISGNIQIKPISVSQSSTFESATADLATDNNMKTFSNFKCAWGKDIWFKMRFDASYCFSEVMIAQSHYHDNAYRMDNTKVFVVNTMTGKESLCGAVKIRDKWSVFWQTYIIPCKQLCGNEVKLAVLHKSGVDNFNACIHMSEILAFYSSGYS